MKTASQVFKDAARWAGLFTCAVVLSGCAVVSVAGAAAGAAISVTGAVVNTGVKVTGAAVGAAIDVVTPDKDEKRDEKKVGNNDEKKDGQ
jgi:hypothetical protein